MPNSRLKTVRDEFLTSIDYYDGFHVNLLFDRFFIDRCAHKWVTTAYKYNVKSDTRRVSREHTRDGIKQELNIQRSNYKCNV